LTFRFLQRKAGEYALTLVDFPPMRCGARFRLEAAKTEIEEGRKVLKASTG